MQLLISPPSQDTAFVLVEHMRPSQCWSALNSRSHHEIVRSGAWSRPPNCAQFGDVVGCFGPSLCKTKYPDILHLESRFLCCASLFPVCPFPHYAYCITRQPEQPSCLLSAMILQQPDAQTCHHFGTRIVRHHCELQDHHAPQLANGVISSISRVPHLLAQGGTPEPTRVVNVLSWVELHLLDDW